MKQYPWYESYDPGFPKYLNYPDRTLYEMIWDTNQQYPDKTACTFMGTKICYSELVDLIDRTAEALTKKGISKGDVATVCLPNVPQAVISFYALNKIGAVVSMVHPLTPAQELKQILIATKSKALFVLNLFLPQYLEILPETGNLFTVCCAIPDYLPAKLSLAFYLAKGRKIKKIAYDDTILPWKEFVRNKSNRKSIRETSLYERAISSDECAVYLHSGGTTGSPKTVKLSSRNFNVLALQGPFIIGVKDPNGLKMASILPFFHGFGLCMGLHTMMVNGINAVLIPIFSSDNLVAMLRKEKPNFIAAVPTLLEGIMNNKKLKSMDLSFIQAVFCGGDTLTAELKRRFDRFLKDHGSKAEVREGYGLTETVTVCCVNPIQKNRESTIGIPLADIRMKVVELNTIEEVAPGTPGEICVSGPTVMLGYLDDPEATAQACRVHEDGEVWVHTGDYGSMDEEGYFRFIQRMKRIVKVSGIPVFPSQIEDVIAKIPQVREVCVIGIPHPYKMQVIKAYISVNDPETVRQEELYDEIRKVCSEHLIRHAIPAQIELMDQLPRTKVGKIDTLVLEKLNEKTVP
jgi:long-chain acyl-CoA synthetase